MSETKPTVGAFDAARELANKGRIFSWHIEEVAHIIDRETNLSELLADSKKLREPATCNAGHKSNLPLALWDCPVCTQLLRDQLQQVKAKAGELLKAAQFKRNAIVHDESPKFVGEWVAVPREDFQKFREGIREVEVALGGKAE